MTFHKIDLRSDGLIRTVGRFSPDLIFHLAAQTSVSTSVADPLRDADINITGTVNLLEAAGLARAKRLVFTSTVALYGRQATLPTREGSPLCPESPYGISKKVVEDYLYFWKHARGLDYSVIRPAHIYGPRQQPTGEAGVVAVFARACLDRTRPTIFGSGTDTRDYVYVEDVVDALLRAAEVGWRGDLQHRNLYRDQYGGGLQDGRSACPVRGRGGPWFPASG